MKKLTKKEIEKIIDYEIVVDCYSDEEVNIGWAIYMEDNMNYPFKADYKVKLKNGKRNWEQVNVLNAFSNESNFAGNNYLVEIEIRDIIVPADLDDLKNILADEQTLRTIQIWKNK